MNRFRIRRRAKGNASTAAGSDPSGTFKIRARLPSNTEGIHFRAVISGRWEWQDPADTPHRNPQDLAASYLRTDAASETGKFSVLDHSVAQLKANAKLGKPAQRNQPIKVTGSVSLEVTRGDWKAAEHIEKQQRDIAVSHQPLLDDLHFLSEKIFKTGLAPLWWLTNDRRHLITNHDRDDMLSTTIKTLKQIADELPPTALSVTEGGGDSAAVSATEQLIHELLQRLTDPAVRNAALGIIEVMLGRVADPRDRDRLSRLAAAARRPEPQR